MSEKSVWCEPYDAEKASEPRTVAKRLGDILSSLDRIDSRVVKGSLPTELSEFRMSLHLRLKAEGWRITAKRDGWKVLPPLRPKTK